MRKLSKEEKQQLYEFVKWREVRRDFLLKERERLNDQTIHSDAISACNNDIASIRSALAQQEFAQGEGRE